MQFVLYLMLSIIIIIIIIVGCVIVISLMRITALQEQQIISQYLKSITISNLPYNTKGEKE